MSYDEIDFAERLGDDDIDIDIDLETGQNDEDYVLEDISSETGHEEAVISNDDVMIDDENVSYPMDDVDTLQEEHIEMEDADLSDMPATALNNPVTYTPLEGTALLQSVGLDEASEIVVVELESHEEPLRYAEVKETALVDKRTVNTDSAHSPPISPAQRNPGAQIGADLHIPLSDPAYNPSFDSGLGNQDTHNPVTTSEITPVTEHTQGELEAKSGKDDNIVLAAEKVIVVYRDAEYALFSSSESDDPDTFFLKDGNLIHGSLADLLAGLREVIHEDLGSEDELCLAAEDLGIEISETCMSIHDVNFASLIDTHEMLLRNDGVQAPGPLFVTLGTKPDFAKRLANLVAGAADGKGMSDLIPWDEESEESEEKVGKNEQLEAANQNTESLSAPTKNHQDDFAGAGAKEEQLLDNVNSELNTGSKAEDAEALDEHNGEQMPEEHGPLATLDNVSPQVNSTLQTTHVSEHLKDGLDEDGDLIDYEDEEYEQSRENSGSVNVDDRGNKFENTPVLDQHLLSPAPEEDEQYDRHSPSIHSEQHHIERSNPGADNDDGNFVGHQEHDEYEGDDVLAHEQTGEEFKVSYEGIEEEGEAKDGAALTDGIATNAEDFFNLLEFDHQPEGSETGDNDAGEIDYSATGQDSPGVQRTDHLITSSVKNTGSSSNVTGVYGQDDDEISYEEADIPNSIESELTLIADESAPDFNFDETKQEHNDEINYDTDDEQELNHSVEQKPAIEELPVSNGLTGKRQRADTEDTTDRVSKQSKRARS